MRAFVPQSEERGTNIYLILYVSCIAFFMIRALATDSCECVPS